FDEQRAHREHDAAAVVGRRLALPERARHDAEHRAAVDTERAVADRRELQAAERHLRDPLLDQATRGLLQLDEHTVRGRGMNEGHERPFGPRPGLFVHQPDAALLQLRQRGADVGAALVDVLRNRRLGRGRLEQFDGGLTGRDEVRPDALGVDLLGHLDLEAERVAEERERLVEVLNRDADVVEDSFHLSSAEPVPRTRLMMSAAAEYGSTWRDAMPSTTRCSSPSGSDCSTICMNRWESRSRSRYSCRV